MTDTEITALAREYAEETTKADASDPNLSDSDLKGIRHDVAEYAEEVIRFLLRRFCLVEKSKVKKEYHEANICRTHVERYGAQWGALTAKMALMERLFPEIAKEVDDD